MRRPFLALGSLPLGFVLILATHSAAAAQSTDVGSVGASVTVASTALSAFSFTDLDFGIHFASEGTVTAENAANWVIDGPADATVDLTFTILPGFLSDGAGHSLGLTYGATSMFTICDDGVGNSVEQSTAPELGFTGCKLGPTGSAAAGLGAGSGVSDHVTADLTGAVDGVYSAVIELTVTIQ